MPVRGHWLVWVAQQSHPQSGKVSMKSLPPTPQVNALATGYLGVTGCLGMPPLLFYSVDSLQKNME